MMADINTIAVKLKEIRNNPLTPLFIREKIIDILENRPEPQPRNHQSYT